MGKSIILMPHFDDELFNSISFLLRYKGEITVHWSSEGDCINSDSYSRNLKDRDTVFKILNEYRKGLGYGQITIGVAPNYGDVNRLGIQSIEWHKLLCGTIESTLKGMDDLELDYFILPSPSIHQSHQECYQIGKSILREPYINKIKEVLIGSYYVDERIPNELGSQPTVFIPMTQDEVDLACRLVEIYIKNHAVNTEELKTVFAGIGYKCGFDYAQSFTSLYKIIKF